MIKNKCIKCKSFLLYLKYIITKSVTGKKWHFVKSRCLGQRFKQHVFSFSEKDIFYSIQLPDIEKGTLHKINEIKKIQQIKSAAKLRSSILTTP